MKRWTAGLTASILAAMLLLGGCTEAPAGSNGVESKETSSATGTSTATTASPAVEIPEPVTGTYNGQTITMKYRLVTDYVWTVDNLKPYAFVNGYLPFAYYGTQSSFENFVGFTFMDREGQLLTEPIYVKLYPFNSEGIALAQKKEGTWVYIDKKGNATETDDYPADSTTVQNWPSPNFSGEESMEQPDGSIGSRMYDNQVIVADYGSYHQYGADYSQLFDLKGNLLNETKFERIGNFYQDIAPVMIDQKLGLVDSKGEVLIEPTLSISLSHSDPLFINEDLIVAKIQGKVGIIEIVRS